MTSDQYNYIKVTLRDSCDFPFPVSLYSMSTYYGRKNWRKLALINKDLSDLLNKEASIEENDENRCRNSIPPLHFSLRQFSDLQETNYVVLDTTIGGIDSTFFTGIILRKDFDKQIVILEGKDSNGDHKKITRNILTPKFMTQDEYLTIRLNRKLEPFYFAKKGKKNLSKPRRRNKLKDTTPIEQFKPIIGIKEQTDRKGYYFIGGLSWSTEPMFVPSKILEEDSNKEVYIISLNSDLVGKQNSIINIKTTSRRWINEDILAKMKIDKNFLDNWLTFQETITDMMIYWDKSLELEKFSAKDFRRSLSVILKSR
jgi:hypothetical protein